MLDRGRWQAPRGLLRGLTPVSSVTSRTTHLAGERGFVWRLTPSFCKSVFSSKRMCFGLCLSFYRMCSRSHSLLIAIFLTMVAFSLPSLPTSPQDPRKEQRLTQAATGELRGPCCQGRGGERARKTRWAPQSTPSPGFPTLGIPACGLLSIKSCQV